MSKLDFHPLGATTLSYVWKQFPPHIKLLETYQSPCSSFTAFTPIETSLIIILPEGAAANDNNY